MEIAAAPGIMRVFRIDRSPAEGAGLPEIEHDSTGDIVRVP